VPRALGAGALALLAAATARADFFEHAWENRRSEAGTWRLSSELRHFRSDSNFHAAGEKVRVTDLGGYARTAFDLSAAYGVNSRLTLFGRANWTLARIDSLAPGISGTSYAPGDQSVGAVFRLLGHAAAERGSASVGGGPVIDLQVQADFPLYRNTSQAAQGLPFVGDQSMDLTFGLFSTLSAMEGSAGSLALEAGLGLTWRSMEYSQAAPWRLGARYASAGGGLRLALGAEGMQSLRTDPSPAPSAFSAENGAGGSFRIGAVNPSFADLAGSLGFRLGERAWLDLRLARTFWGERAPAALKAGAGVSLELPTAAARPARRRPKPPVSQTPAEYGKSNRGFVKYGTEAKVASVLDDPGTLRVDRGSRDGIEAGQVFDLFRVTPDGSLAEAVARARVTDARYDDATLTVTEYFAEVMVQEGFVVKRLLD
jgi:hypothetical protein